MTPAALDEIQKGWKVYANAAEIGRIEDVGYDEVVVRRGRLIHHSVHVPAEYVDSASDGIVDLKLDPEDVKRLESDH